MILSFGLATFCAVISGGAVEIGVTDGAPNAHAFLGLAVTMGIMALGLYVISATLLIAEKLKKG
ncbi:MAG: hypothetical protein V1704_04010 [Candidatus Vogelbacteria bacterium]